MNATRSMSRSVWSILCRGLVMVLMVSASPADPQSAAVLSNPIAGADVAAAWTDSVPNTAEPREQALPEGASTDWWAAVQEDIRWSEYHATWQDQTYLPDLHLRVNQTHNWVDACTSLGATVQITVTDAIGNVKGTASGVALREDGCAWAGDFNWDGGAPDIVVGDHVDGSSSDGSVATVTVITITGQVDVEANILSGQVLGVSYPATMKGEIWEEGASSPEIQTDDQGDFTLDFNPFDIQPGMEVAAWYIQPDGNWAGAVFRASRPPGPIQAAINAAEDGDTVIIATGIYTENINFNGKNITVRSENPDDPSIVQATIINGGANGSVVTFESGETSTAVLEGFTIKNGLPEDLQNGGGIFIANASPIIANNTITANGAEQAGGGIYVADHSSPIIKENVITGNIAAHRGGGIDVRRGSSPEIRDNEITNNVAEVGSGVDVADNSSPTIISNTISYNAAGGDLDFNSVEKYLAGEVEDVLAEIQRFPQTGGGIYVVNNCSPTITQNTISGNIGGGIAALLNSSPGIEGNTIKDNTGGRTGAGVLAALNSSPNIEGNTIISNESPWSGGIEVYDSSSPLIKSNLIEDNAGEFGAGIYVWQDSRPVVVDNIFQNNHATNEEGGPMWVDYTSSVLDEEGNVLPDPDTSNTYIDNSPPENHIEPDPPQGPFPPGQEHNVPQDFATIQAAIDVAEDGDTVIVAPGTYHESIDFRGKNVTVRSQNPENPDVVATTIIDGGKTGEEVVVFERRETSSMLAGFTIENTAAPGNLAIYCSGSSPTIANNIISNNIGGGIGCGHACSAVIKDNVIRDNTAEIGGGINCQYSSPTIEGNIISGNSGGGIHLWFSSPSIINNTISGNVRSNNGGGIFHDHFSRATVKGNVIRENRAEGGGGAIYCDHYSCETIAGNIIVANHANYSGGGIFLWTHSSPKIENNVIAENTAEDGGGIAATQGSSPIIVHNTIAYNTAAGSAGINLSWGSPVVITNTILWNSGDDIAAGDASTPVVNYSNIEQGWPGEGNFSANPLFVDQANGDYHLRFDSPCIDAGTDEGAPEIDFEGNPRSLDGNSDGVAVVDIGADEFTLLGDHDHDCDVDVEDIMLVANCWRCRSGEDDCYDARYDLDEDGDIDIVDIMLVVKHWGETCE